MTTNPSPIRPKSDAVRVANCDHRDTVDGEIDTSSETEFIATKFCLDCDATITVVYRPMMAKIAAADSGYSEIAGVTDDAKLAPHPATDPEVIEP